jgi:N-acetyl-anhydromuramyl-L-alanine amidase AmpD
MKLVSKKSVIFLLIFVFVSFGYFAVMKGKILGSNKLIVSGLKESNVEPDVKEKSANDSQTPSVQEEKQEELSSKNEEVKDKEKQAESNQKLPDPSSNQNFFITDKYISWGYEKPEKTRSIDTIVIHSSYNALGGDPYSLEKLLSEYKQYGVSAHYVIDREGKIYRLVSEKNIAYHAGVSKVPDGRTGVNNFSIGIELMNKEDSKFTDDQYESLNNLLSDIKKRYKIKYVLGHNQIAPGRKSDPWNFEWGKL